MKHGFLEILLLSQHKTDPRLALHAKRVACYASEIAKLLGLEDKFKKVFMAGLLHDLGFLSIDIDFSESGLDLAQKKNIKLFQSHATESERLLSSLTADKELLETIRHHHEKFDGNGYPDQLAGEDIPLLARILAVADLYDSLLVGKLYGEKRITPADALTQMSNNNNEISLDPAIVDVLIKLLEKNPVLLQPDEHNALGIYSMIFLTTGPLEQGDLVNQDGTVLLRQGAILDEKTLEKIRLEFPGQKLIRPIPADIEDDSEND